MAELAELADGAAFAYRDASKATRKTLLQALVARAWHVLQHVRGQLRLPEFRPVQCGSVQCEEGSPRPLPCAAGPVIGDLLPSGSSLEIEGAFKSLINVHCRTCC